MLNHRKQINVGTAQIIGTIGATFNAYMGCG